MGSVNPSRSFAVGGRGREGLLLPTGHARSLTRRSLVKGLGLAAAGLVLAGPLAACSRDGQDAPGVVCAFNPDDEPGSEGFDPLYGWGCDDVPHRPLLQSTLLSLGPSDELVGDLALDWGFDDAGTTLSFRLRNDVVFSDGRRLTADDVAFTIASAKDADGVKLDLSAVKDAHAEDDETVVLDLSRPSQSLLLSLCFLGIVPRDGYDPISYGTDPVGSGPYTLSDWDHGATVVFDKNPAYYGNVTIPRVTVRFLGEEEACAACYSGDVDLAWTSPRLTDQPIDGYSLLDCSSANCFGVSLPIDPANTPRTIGGVRMLVGNSVTTDVAIRRALGQGVDRKALIKSALQGYGNAAFSPAQNTPWSNSDINLAQADADAAKRSLDASGWTTGSDGIRSKGDLRASCALYVSSNKHHMKYSFAKKLAQKLSDQAKGLGIELSVAEVDDGQVAEHAYTDPVMLTWKSGLPQELWGAFASASTWNLPCYRSAATDGYLAQADAQTDQSAAVSLWKKAQWDGSAGPCAQGDAAYAFLCDVDQVYFKRGTLDTGAQRTHTSSSGWSVLEDVPQWAWLS